MGAANILHERGQPMFSLSLAVLRLLKAIVRSWSIPEFRAIHHKKPQNTLEIFRWPEPEIT